MKTYTLIPKHQLTEKDLRKKTLAFAIGSLLLMAQPAISSAEEAIAFPTTSGTVQETPIQGKRAMTWRILDTRLDGQGNYYFLYSSDERTDPYQGDLDVTQVATLLCIRKDGSNKPDFIPPSYTTPGGAYRQAWSGGETLFINDVPGTSLTSLETANNLCENAGQRDLGVSGFRMAEFHDGGQSAGWDFWAKASTTNTQLEGQFPWTKRFWVSINDQPNANPWEAGVTQQNPDNDNNPVDPTQVEAVTRDLLDLASGKDSSQMLKRTHVTCPFSEMTGGTRKKFSFRRQVCFSTLGKGMYVDLSSTKFNWTKRYRCSYQGPTVQRGGSNTEVLMESDRIYGRALELALSNEGKLSKLELKNAVTAKIGQMRDFSRNLIQVKSETDTIFGIIAADPDWWAGKRGVCEGTMEYDVIQTLP